MATNRMGVIGVPRILGGENMAIGRRLGGSERDDGGEGGASRGVLVLLSRVVML